MLKNDQPNHTEKAPVAENNIRLEAACKLPKRMPINPILGAVSLALSIILGVLSLNNNSPFLGVLALMLVLCAIGFFIAETFMQTKLNNAIQTAMDKANQTYFEDAEVIPVFSTERMFQSDSDKNKSFVIPKRAVGNSESTADTELTFADTVAQFTAFAAERGCKLDANSARELFAAMAASRVLVYNELPAAEFALLVGVIGEYFGTQACPDVIENSYTNENSLLFTADGQKKSVMLTIEAAQAQSDKIHVIALQSVDTSTLTSYFNAFINYAKAPGASHYLSVDVGEETDTYYLPSNLWVMLNLAGDQRIASLPEKLLEVASVSNISISTCDNAEAPTPLQAISYSQMSILIAQAKCRIDETEWKKFDVFADFLEKQVAFTISNKQWIGMEKYIAVCNACGENDIAALDRAISAKILPSVFAKALNTDKKVDIISGLMNAFENTEMPNTRKAAKALGKFSIRV